jgi:hypothetical protein
MEKYVMTGPGLIQVGPTRFMDARLAAKEGVRRYVPRAAGASARPVAATAVIKTGAPTKTPAPRPSKARSTPRDIPAAMRLGLSNAEIDALVAQRVLHRPRNLMEAGYLLWAVDDWQEAKRRGFVW